ncbi:HAD family hydrolase [Nanoarchaeota archaeon]
MRECLFDLDGTLIDTSRLRPFNCTREGKQFVVENPDKVPTKPYYDQLVKLVNKLSKHKKAEIVTNSPHDYSEVLLRKHGFSEIKINASLGKPNKAELLHKSSMFLDAIIIGDNPIDMLTAHGLEIPSIAVTWGESTPKRLAKSEPSIIVSDISELEEAIEKFGEGKINYNKRENTEKYAFLETAPLRDPEIKLSFLDDYYPVTKYPYANNPKYDFASDVLRFKESKEIRRSKIKEGQRSEYFFNGRIKEGKRFKDVIQNFYSTLLKKIDSMNLVGETAILAAPNSLPEFCYFYDINNVITKSLNSNHFGNSLSKRVFYRVYPKSSSHEGGNREGHYSTTGVKKGTSLREFKNVILFDDVYTSGSQIRSLGNIARELCDFKGNLHSLTLGKTF